MIRVKGPELDPATALALVARGERPFLLDGSSDADGLGRYSFAGCDPDDGLVWELDDAGQPLELLQAAARRWNDGPLDEHPWPLAVGYLSYDLGAAMLARGAGRRLCAREELGMPALDFARYPAIWRFDRVRGASEVLARDGAAAERLLSRLSRSAPPLLAPRLGAPRWSTSTEEYFRRVERALDYLRAGDAYQVNLAHRLHVPLDEKGALAVYLRLRALAPAPLGSFLRTGAGTLLSNTPELLLRSSRQRLETRPIKGTRRRGASGAEDARLASELEASEKDRAEHLMIVDLERNDLGQVAEIGSVQVAGFGRRLELPTVHHLVSTVAARPRAGVELAEILGALLPGGSITGAPKLRAVEIIDELEQVRRGPYCGGIGWVGGGGSVTLALAIRTAVVRAGELTLAVGGGIVADSTPEDELEETRVKAEAFVRALG